MSARLYYWRLGVCPGLSIPAIVDYEAPQWYTRSYILVGHCDRILYKVKYVCAFVECAANLTETWKTDHSLMFVLVEIVFFTVTWCILDVTSLKNVVWYVRSLATFSFYLYVINSSFIAALFVYTYLHCSHDLQCNWNGTFSVKIIGIAITFNQKSFPTPVIIQSWYLYVSKQLNSFNGYFTCFKQLNFSL